MEFGSLKICDSSDEVLFCSESGVFEKVKITKPEFRIIKILLDNVENCVVSEEIVASAWKGMPRGSNSLLVAISNIRKQKELTKNFTIKTHYGIGYSLHFVNNDNIEGHSKSKNVNKSQEDEESIFITPNFLSIIKYTQYTISFFFVTSLVIFILISWIEPKNFCNDNNCPLSLISELESFGN